MATNLQVNASTQQAVGAFNALAASIANTTSQFNQLNSAMARNGSTASRYAGSVTAINSAFNNLMSIANGARNAIMAVGTGLLFVFNSVIKELDKLQGFNAIMSVSTKSADDVSASFNFLRATADRLGVQFDSLTGNYAKLVAALPPGIKGLQTAEKVFMGTAMAARTLHSTNQDTQLMFYALTQMASKGVVSMEELRRQLGEKLPGVMQIAARALNTLPENLEAAIRKGIVSSEKFLPIFGDALIRTFADSSEKASQSVSAAIARLSNVWVDFVKNVLDSGAGDSIVGVFDALREKLSDPYLIERFAILIKTLSERVTQFIENISADDLRNGFDTATRAIEMVVEVVGKLIEGITWIINNADKAGAIMGALGGAAVGSLAGPVGAAVGAVGGAAGGYYVGSQLMPTAEQTAARASANQAAEQARAVQRQEQEMLKFTQLIPLLQQFKGLNSFNGLDRLFTAQSFNTKTLGDLNRILTGNEFRTDAERAQGVRDYAKYGTVVGPQTNRLSDVLNTGKGKKSSAETSLDASQMRAMGLNPNVQKELANYLTLLRTGRLNMDQYTDAVQTLISKQPYMIENMRAEREAAQANSREFEKFMQVLLDQIQVREDLRISLEEDTRLAGLRSDDLRIEQQVIAEQNRFRQAGLDMSQTETAELREKLRVIEAIRTTMAAQQQVLAATVDKWLPQINMLKGIKSALQDPTSGLTQTQASDYVVNQDPNAQGSEQWMDAQRRSVEEYYRWVDTLRQNDLIQENTAQMMKARAMQQYDNIRLSQSSEFFDNLSTLSRSGNKKVAAVGRAAAVAAATIDGYVAIQKALASAPPPVNYALAASVGVATAANIAGILGVGGFYDGGFTGNGPRTGVAGVVHGQEFVVNASATARNRATLEAMNRGAVAAPSTSSGQVVNNISIVNRADGTTVRQDEKSNETGGKDLEIIIETVAARSVTQGGKLADAVQSTFRLNRAMGALR